MLEAEQRGRSIQPSKRDALTGTKFLAAFGSSGDRQALKMAALPDWRLQAYTDLVREDGASDQLYVLSEGWACRFKTTRDGSRQIVGLVLPGELANLDTLLFNRADFGMRVLTSAKVVAIPCDAALSLAERRPGVAGAFTRLALIENAILSQWALCLGRKSALQRLAHLLCELAVRLCGDVEDPISFNLPLTQEQLADTLGLTSVHVNWMLQLMRHEGLIEFVRRVVTLLDAPKLREVAEFDPAYLYSPAVA